jgi:hypothetical protein
MNMTIYIFYMMYFLQFSQKFLYINNISHVSLKINAGVIACICIIATIDIIIIGIT